jgi:hypothetical protein
VRVGFYDILLIALSISIASYYHALYELIQLEGPSMFTGLIATRSS